ncbi:MAG TPA: helix-hairpin-helix domain-containing protein [Caulobacteraceae bacterium]|nr:helix-hairpin-helix domain-containing protein [Caulobacteraceae bacterium]
MTRPPSASSKAGFALPSVLFVVAMVTLVFLVAIEALASLAAETRAALAATRFQTAALSAEADVAFDAATRPLGPRAILASPAPGAAELVRLDGAPYATGADLMLSAQDEAGLVNVDALAPAARAHLFAAMGVAPLDVAALADRLADYIDPDDLRRPLGAETDDYARLGLPPPPNASLVRRDQLQGLLGWRELVGTSRWRAFQDDVTADPNSLVVNVNTATPAALETWYGLTPAQAEAALAYRARTPFTGVADLERLTGRALLSDAELVYTMPNGRFALKVEDRRSGLAYRSRLILTPGDAERPFWIVEPTLQVLTAAEKATPPVHALAFPDPAA